MKNGAVPLAQRPPTGNAAVPPLQPPPTGNGAKSPKTAMDVGQQGIPYAAATLYFTPQHLRKVIQGKQRRYSVEWERKYYFSTPPFAAFSSKFDLVFCNVHTEEENVSPPNVDVKIIQFARGLFCLGTRS